MTHIGRFSQYRTAPVQSQKMRDQFSRNRYRSEASPFGFGTSLAAHEADKSAAPIPHSLLSDAPQTAADKPDTIPPLVGSGTNQVGAA
jgi:hypothetical protein